MKNESNRFALAGSDGRLVALVADGLPEWPDDLTAVEDDTLRTLEGAFLAEFDRIAADTEADTSELDTLRDRILELRTEAARRIDAATVVEGEPGETDPPDPNAPAATDPPEGGAGDDEREARIAALRATLDPPAPEGTLLEVTEGMSREDIATMIADGAAASAAAAATAVITALHDQPSTQGEPISAADLSGYRSTSAGISPTASVRTTPRLPARLVTSADVPNARMGEEITDVGTLVARMISRHKALGRSTGVDDESIPVATLAVDVPNERDLRDSDWATARRKISAMCGPEAVGVDPWTGKEALIASGGLAAMVQPYYGQLVIAQGARPVRDALPTFAADRGGIQLVLPPSLATLLSASQPGVFADGVTNSDTSFVSATAAFTVGDVGQLIVGSGIPAGTRIVSRTNATTLVLSAATTATATGVTFTLPQRNPNNLGAPVALQSVAQDAAGGVKYTYDVPNGTKAEFDVYAVYTSLQFANLASRTFPELVEANIRLADALAARVAETQMLDVITAWSTLMTGGKTFGTARQLLAQLGHMAAWYRNSERMDPNAVLRVGLPAWSLQAMRADVLSTFGSAIADWGLSDDEIAGILQKHRLVPFFYQDGPSDVSQLFATTGVAAATNAGTNSATPMAIPDFPGTGATTSFRTKIVSFMWAEGTWLGLTTGELNLGLVRDSILNSQNRFRNFQEEWETPAFVGTRSLRGVHTVAADGTYGAAASITLGVGSGL